MIRTGIISIISCVGAVLTCLMCDAPTTDYPIHYALWYLIIAHENPEKKDLQ